MGMTEGAVTPRRKVCAVLAAIVLAAACTAGGNTGGGSANDAAEGGAGTSPPHAGAGGDRTLGGTSPTALIDLVLALRMRDPEALDRYLDGLYDPSSPFFRRFLDAAEFGRRFGLAERDVDSVVDYLRRHHVRVKEIFPQRTAIRAQGSARAVEALFGVTLRDWVDASGVRYHAPLSRPVIPEEIRPLVSGVGGLSTEPVFRSASVLPALEPCPEESGIADPCLTPDGAARAYNITPLYELGIRGEGQTVAIVSFGSFNDGDVAFFERVMGVDGGPPVEHVEVNGGAPVGPFIGEVNLDVDIVRGIAPQAQILNYEAEGTDVSIMVTVLNRIAADGRADIVSISYGACDDPRGGIARLFRRLFGDSLAAMVAQGISVFVASGDDGAYGCRRRDPADDRPTVSWPASSPDVVAVGGTLLSVRQDGSYLQEAGWEDILSEGGSGGGLNPIDSRPDYQAGTGVENEFSNGKRQVPDVAAASDPNSGFFVAFTPPGASEPIGDVLGGTSAAAPFWAASMALVRQFAEQEGLTGGLGFLNPVFYRIAAKEGDPTPSFHDVTLGGNRLHDATPGWDYATGLGSPDVFNLAQDVVEELQGGGAGTGTATGTG